MKPERIMFICSGNICRSPLAHAVFEHLVREQGLNGSFEVESSGTDAYHVGENADSRMRRVAAGNGIKLDHTARRFTRSDLENYDRIYVMDRGHLRTARSMAGGDPDLAGKIRLFREFDPEASGAPDVPDPWYGGMDGFEQVFKIVMRTCRNLLSELTSGSRRQDQRADTQDHDRDGDRDRHRPVESDSLRHGIRKKR